MDTTFSVFLSLRKFFGFLVPGFSWLLLVMVLLPIRSEEMVDGIPEALQGPVFVGAIIIVLSYLVGGLATVVSFRILELFGDGADLAGRHVSSGRGGAPLRFLRDRFHLLSDCTLLEEVKRRTDEIPNDVLKGAGARDLAGIQQWDVYKMYVLEHAPALAREVLELEAEINLVAGMVLPVMVAGVVLLREEVAWGWALIVVATLLALRFQNLRHHEVILVSQAYRVLKAD
jgi:hypothetical protein